MKKNNKKVGVKRNSKMSSGKMVTLGAGVAALGAGAYYLFGPNAKMHQKKAATLLAKMKKEVVSKIKKAKVSTKPFYDKSVDLVVKNYAKQYKLHGDDIKAFANKIKSELGGMLPKSAKKTVKKVARNLVKKK